jgi:hypothetical protein
VSTSAACPTAAPHQSPPPPPAVVASRGLVEDITGPRPTIFAAKSSSGGEEPNVNMAHLELYHHFSKPPSSNYFFCLATLEMADTMKDSAMKHSVQVPYLMHQLLAISARDKSGRAADEDARASYLNLAVQLQNHAIALFDASNPGSPPLSSSSSVTRTPILAFASMLGTHALCDALTTLVERPGGEGGGPPAEEDECQQQHSSPLQDFLARWLDYARLHRRVNSHAQVAASSTHSAELQPLVRHGRAMAERQPAGHQTDALLARIAALQDLSPEVLAACLAAVDLLQVAIDMGNDGPGSSSSSPPPPPPPPSAADDGAATTSSSNSTRLVSSSPEHLPIWWALSVPDAFVEALATGNPDLVAVLAYYAVLLHRARDCWAVGPAAGTRLLQVLTAHLGLRYTEVLAYPRRELGLGHFGAVL